MPDQPPALKFSWLLGDEGYQRVCLLFWVITSSAYALYILLLFYCASIGLADIRHVWFILIASVCGLGTFYAILRSGRSKNFADPSLSVQQMAFAVVTTGMLYVLTPGLRGVFLLQAPVVLVFGAFTLTPRNCRLLGVFAVLVQAVATVLSIWLNAKEGSTQVEIIFFISAVVVFIMATDMAGRLSAIREQLREQKKQLQQALDQNALLARQDELTTLPNRRHAIEMMAYEERRTRRDKVRPSVCMIDIDHFKRINDTHGHAAGDAVLRLLARHALLALRRPDILARWGGEEFILLMPETTLTEAAHVVERLRRKLADIRVWEEHPELQVTFSAGIATLAVNESMQDTVARADVALYRAKEQGRNRTVMAD